MLTFKIYTDRSQQWRWTLYAGNFRKIADSGESYLRKQDCKEAINLIKGGAQAALIEE